MSEYINVYVRLPHDSTVCRYVDHIAKLGGFSREEVAPVIAVIALDRMIGAPLPPFGKTDDPAEPQSAD